MTPTGWVLKTVVAIDRAWKKKPAEAEAPLLIYGRIGQR